VHVREANKRFWFWVSLSAEGGDGSIFCAIEDQGRALRIYVV
jgi:hypothetical protein